MFTLTTTLNLTVYWQKLKKKKFTWRGIFMLTWQPVWTWLFHRLGQYSVIIPQYKEEGELGHARLSTDHHRLYIVPVPTVQGKRSSHARATASIYTGTTRHAPPMLTVLPLGGVSGQYTGKSLVPNIHLQARQIHQRLMAINSYKIQHWLIIDYFWSLQKC